MNDENQKIADAVFVGLNGLMGEINASRIVFLLAQDEFYDKKINPQADEQMRNNCKVYMRRLAMSGFASVAFKYREIYEKLLKPIGCATEEAKELYKEFGKGPLEVWRGINQHVLDDKTKQPHSSNKIIETHMKVFESFPELFKGDSSRLISKLNRVRDQVEERFPQSKDAVQRNYEELKREEGIESH